MNTEQGIMAEAGLEAELGGWYPALPEEARRGAAETMDRVLQLRAEGRIIYPPQGEILRALRTTQPQAVKCVILGQDPYHGPGQANGMSFSVEKTCKLPPSLRNIFKELCADIGCDVPPDGDLSGWAEQGVLLLNSVLTVEQGKPASHAGLGWRNLTGEIVRYLLTLKQPIVFLLWGNYAQAVVETAWQACPEEPRHKLKIASVHPSPLSARRGFFGSRPFSRANEYLQQEGVAPIHWNIW